MRSRLLLVLAACVATMATVACAEGTDTPGADDGRPGRTSQDDTVGQVPRADPPPIPIGFIGDFSTMDELQRCKAAPNAVVCASTGSGQRVRLDRSGATYEGEVAISFPAADPLGVGNEIETASGIRCLNSRRGIECSRGGHGFVIGDSAVVILRGPHEERYEPTSSAPEPEPEPEPEYIPEPDYQTDPDYSPGTDDGCDPNYDGACIPEVPYDLDCPEVAASDFYSVGYDPHGFDGDNDGIACESY